VATNHLPPYWAQHLAAVLGGPQRAETDRFLHAWAQAEGGTATWNPLNSTFRVEGSTAYNSAGVQNYPRPVWGVCATAMTLTNGNYGTIVGRIQAGNLTAEQIVNDCATQIGVWGTDPGLILTILGGG
jgi:transglutaminase-like putative cysteine protease